MGKKDTAKIIKSTPKVYRRNRPNDYLKYHRIIMAWARKKYKISTVHLEMLFFLYSEDIFTQTKFKEYSMIMPFDRHKLERMIQDGWIRKWRSEEDHRYALYEMTLAAKYMVAAIYKKFNGEQVISESVASNELMDKTNKNTRMYSIGIRRMNKQLRMKKIEERKKLINPDD